MDSFIDLKVQRDPEFPARQLMATLYAKLHRALVTMRADSVAVAFPYMQVSHLGDTLRLMAPRDVLIALMDQQWLHGMRDHTQVGEITRIPSNAVERPLRRVQAKSSPERQLRRTIKRLSQREGISESDAAAKVSVGRAKHLDLPFLHVKSASTGHSFRLFLRLGPECAKNSGTFNAYGLSQDATIPWF
jgi:CRISPR-associated endonuclease Csy4